ncbi:hypothetical protein [Nonomuraea typhae]|uniref:hypothetical protein n=1 Tax=Nonomuraea typhae TaxID=2603600 RepID=UPI0012F70FCE|nr:hypothetical protein [Nonomuraea typhae]
MTFTTNITTTIPRNRPSTPPPRVPLLNLLWGSAGGGILAVAIVAAALALAGHGSTPAAVAGTVLAAALCLLTTATIATRALGRPAAPAQLPADDADPAQIRALYRERAALIAAVAATCPAVLCDNDPAAGRPVVYLTTPYGQLSWHIDAADLDLFANVRIAAPGDADAPVWDGHSTTLKHGRLAAYTRLLTMLAPLAGERATAICQAGRPGERPFAGRWSGLLLTFGEPTVEGHRMLEPTLQSSDPWMADAELFDENGIVIGSVEEAWILNGALYGSGSIFATPAGRAAIDRLGGPVEVQLSAADVAPVQEGEQRLVLEHRLHEPWHVQSVRLRDSQTQPAARIAIVAAAHQHP